MSEMIQVKVEARKIVLDWMSANSFIQVNKSLLRKIGDTNTILLAESIRQYERWEQKDLLQPDGSFYWTQMDCEIETGYSRSTQQRAYKDMEKRGLLKTYNKKYMIGSIEKSIRFVKLYFPAIANLMFEDDSKIIEDIKNKYSDLLDKNQQSKKKSKERSMIQNESSLDMTGMIQNESSGWVKMNHPDDSKRITSKKEDLIKKDNSLRNKKNLSIIESINKLDIPSVVCEMLKTQIDRLMLLNIKCIEIELVFKDYQTKMGHDEFQSVLYDCLQAEKIDKSFKKYLATSLDNRLKNKIQKENVLEEGNAFVRQEMVPDHFKESSYETDYSQYDFNQQVEIDPADIEKRKRAFEENLKKYRNA